jgi:L-aminopeptidase/D-esterase-like protein
MGSLGWGFKVGHWTDAEHRTGCTVVLPPPGNVTSCDVRGGGPSSRELELLDPARRMTEVHGILLTGGSAFGLAAADGVVEWLAEKGVGYQTPAARVPIVPGAVVYDLAAGDPAVRPGPEAGRLACDDARTDDVAEGLVGAGTGCTVGKWAGPEHRAPGGLGFGSATAEGHTVTALAVVNAIGDVVHRDGRIVAGTAASDRSLRKWAERHDPEVTNTVLAVVTTSAALTKAEVRFLAGRGSDGITIAVRPAHMRYDGDVVFACAAPPDPSSEPLSVDVLGVLATEAVADAVRAGVGP